MSAPVRLQEYGVGVFLAAATKSAWKKVIKKDCVQVNGHVATTATYITGGEAIQLSIPDTPSTDFDFPLRVLFEDEFLAVIEKPAGIEVSGNRRKTIANALPRNLAASNALDAILPQPVHRLDYATSGVLVVGKTSTVIRDLNMLFADKKVDKTYWAVSIGELSEKGVIKALVDGKPSETTFKRLGLVESPRFKYLSLIELNPKTGRRHQIRKHLHGLGHPILGDKTYFIDGLILNGKGLYLHAKSVRFKHPISGEWVEVHSQIPEKFTRIFGNVE